MKSAKIADTFTNAYMEAIYFTDTGEEGQPPEDAEMSLEAIERCWLDCAKFQEANGQLLYQAYDTGYTEEQAGHDFWLTRNGHCIGFWDRGLGAIGDILNERAKVFGELNAYLGDDNQIHL